MTMTDDAVVKATEGLDDNLAVVDDAAKDKDVTVTDDSKKDDKATETDKDAKADEYTAADLEIEDDKPTTKVEVTDVDTSGLNAEQKYIVDNLPLMTARIKDGDTVKEIQVKSWTQLPEDVTFATKRDELAFMNALTAQENRAQQLQQKFQADSTSKQSQEFERLENDAIREDIARLQQSGDLPKFKTKIEDANFSKDPATQEVQKVLDYMHERNKQYLSEYQQGRPYRHIGFEEAFRMYTPTAKKDSAQKAEDKERKDMADKVGGNKGLTQREMKRPTVKSGTRIEQILERVDAEW